MTTKSRIFTALFGLPFACVGLGFLFLSIIPTLWEASQIKGWDKVYAQLTSVDLKTSRSDNTTSYQATASYRFSYQGGSYQGSRVGLNDGYDNIGSYHEDMNRRLKRLRDKGSTVAVYVNPANPNESIIDPDIRWGMVGFKLIFVVLFGGIGVGIIVFALFSKDKRIATPDGSAKPWTKYTDWNSPVIYSGAKKSVWAVWIFAFIWNAISWPVVFAVPSELDKGNTAVLIGLLFPIVGLGMLVWAIKTTLEWRRFGKTPLTLDPYPGSIGGDVGGDILVNTSFDPSLRYQVNLACVYSYVSGSGKNRTRNERVVWDNQGIATAQPDSAGTRIFFKFDVPQGLPQSEQHSDRYHHWRVKLTCVMPGVDLNRQFDIPVFPTAQKATQQHSMDTGATFEENAQALGRIMQIHQDNEGLAIYYGMWRSLGLALMMCVFGVVFGGGGIVAGMSGAPMLFPIVFGAVGGLILLFGLYLPLNTLEVRMTNWGIYTRRTLCGIVVSKKALEKSQVSHLDICSSSSQGQTQFFNVEAHGITGATLRLAEGIPGRRLAEEALATIKSLTGYD